MSPIMSRAQRRVAFTAAAVQMFDRLEEWYDQHPAATFGELETETRQQRRQLMGQTLAWLINGRDLGFQLTAPLCPECGQAMEFERYRSWTIQGLEGATALSRAYYVCPRCPGETLFPPGPEAAVAGGPLERGRGAGGHTAGVTGPVL
jgi:hypothetical protein